MDHSGDVCRAGPDPPANQLGGNLGRGGQITAVYGQQGVFASCIADRITRQGVGGRTSSACSSKGAVHDNMSALSGGLREPMSMRADRREAKCRCLHTNPFWL